MLGTEQHEESDAEIVSNRQMDMVVQGISLKTTLPMFNDKLKFYLSCNTRSIASFPRTRTGHYHNTGSLDTGLVETYFYT